MTLKESSKNQRKENCKERSRGLKYQKKGIPNLTLKKKVTLSGGGCISA